MYSVMRTEKDEDSVMRRESDEERDEERERERKRPASSSKSMSRSETCPWIGRVIGSLQVLECRYIRIVLPVCMYVCMCNVLVRQGYQDRYSDRLFAGT
jgi:hypothetical protein